MPAKIKLELRITSYGTYFLCVNDLTTCMSVHHMHTWCLGKWLLATVLVLVIEPGSLIKHRCSKPLNHFSYPRGTAF